MEGRMGRERYFSSSVAEALSVDDLEHRKQEIIRYFEIQFKDEDPDLLSFIRESISRRKTERAIEVLESRGDREDYFRMMKEKWKGERRKEKKVCSVYEGDNQDSGRGKEVFQILNSELVVENIESNKNLSDFKKIIELSLLEKSDGVFMSSREIAEELGFTTTQTNKDQAYKIFVNKAYKRGVKALKKFGVEGVDNFFPENIRAFREANGVVTRRLSQPDSPKSWLKESYRRRTEDIEGAFETLRFIRDYVLDALSVTPKIKRAILILINDYYLTGKRTRREIIKEAVPDLVFMDAKRVLIEEMDKRGFELPDPKAVRRYLKENK